MIQIWGLIFEDYQIILISLLVELISEFTYRVLGLWQNLGVHVKQIRMLCGFR